MDLTEPEDVKRQEYTEFSVQSLSHVWLCDPMDCSTPGLPVHHQLLEFTQTHVHWVGDTIQPSYPLLEWVAFPFSRGSSQPRDLTQVSCVAGGFFTSWATREAQEYTEELYKKDLHDPDNHDGVITHLKPDILECEVKWALESITVNKASGGDGIPVELFQILEDDAVKVLHSICQHWKIQQWPLLKKISFHSNPKERQCQRTFKLPHNCTHFIR